MQAKQAIQELTECAQWFSPLNFSATQAEIRKKRQDGTGQWLLDSDIFQRWVSGGERVLWCPGIPGSGKTILASTVVDYLKSKFEHANSVAISCIYFNYKEQQTPETLIGSLLRQLILGRGPIAPEIRKLFDKHVSYETRPTLDEIICLLQSKIYCHSRFYVVVDALDECTDEAGVRSSFLRAMRSLSGPISLFFTSRYLPEIVEEFSKDLQLEIHASVEDITLFVKGCIRRGARLFKHTQSDPSLEDTIVKSITGSSKGM